MQSTIDQLYAQTTADTFNEFADEIIDYVGESQKALRTAYTVWYGTTFAPAPAAPTAPPTKPATDEMITISKYDLEKYAGFACIAIAAALLGLGADSVWLAGIIFSFAIIAYGQLPEPPPNEHVPYDVAIKRLKNDMNRAGKIEFEPITLNHLITRRRPRAVYLRTNLAESRRVAESAGLRIVTSKKTHK